MFERLVLTDAGDFELEREPDFGIRPPAIATAQQRLEAWSRVAIGGSTNLVHVDGVTYCWEARPRAQKNGALVGRVYAQRAGEILRDVGAYKIDAGGRVLQIPAELAGVLPGAAGAEAARDEEAVP